MWIGVPSGRRVNAQYIIRSSCWLALRPPFVLGRTFVEEGLYGFPFTS